MEENTKIKKTHWTFLTNHAHVLLCLAKNPSMRIRDLALEVKITERAVQKIIAELIEENYLIRDKEGRRNVYTICHARPLKHSIEWHKNTDDLINLILH